jgi:hypothetical protein
MDLLDIRQETSDKRQQTRDIRQEISDKRHLPAGLPRRHGGQGKAGQTKDTTMLA